MVSTETLVNNHNYPLRHPLGILPEGNLYIDGIPNLRNVGGLGMFRILEDAQVAEVLEYLCPISLTQLMQASKTFYSYCISEDLWMQFVLSEYNGRFRFLHSWRQTFISIENKKKSIVRKEKEYFKITISGLYSDLLFQRWLCSATDIHFDWLRRETLPRIDSSGITRASFIKDYVLPGLPVILTGLAADWSARKLWTKEYLIESCGNAVLEAGSANFQMEQFFEYATTNHDEAPLFIFDPKFVDYAPRLGNDYSVPHFFSDDLFSLLPNRPNYRWLLIGNRKSGSKWHIDPNRTHAWNGVISGRKRWMFFPPGTPPPGVFPSNDGAEVMQPLSLIDWYRNFHKPAINSSNNARLIEGTCEAGDVVFVPREWWHAVINLDDNTYAVTQNCVTPEICNDVRWFLKYKSDQVSGVCEERKKTLWKEFDAALKLHRPELLTNLPSAQYLKKHIPVSTTTSSNSLVEQRNRKVRCLEDNESPSVNNNYLSDEACNNTNAKTDKQNNVSFWESWRQSKKRLIIVSNQESSQGTASNTSNTFN